MLATRRAFLRNSTLAAVGAKLLPGFLATKHCHTWEPSVGNKRLIVIFQRGAADGLNIVVPHGEQSYYDVRPSINIPRRSVIDLDGFFGLHPALSAFQPFWGQGHLAIVHATGSPDPTRSHFDAQDFMESGTPGIKGTKDGWLNRVLHCLSAPGETAACRSIAMGFSVPRILAPVQGSTILSGDSGEASERKTGEAASVMEPGRGSKQSNLTRMICAHGRFPDHLAQLAQQLKADRGIQVAFADVGGWDHHVDEGGPHGQLADRLHEFSQALVTLWTDLGDLVDDTVLITMSEFGRSVRENRNRGTDHGHANVMFVLGGPVKGGKVYGRWPGLNRSQLHCGRDLAVTTDFRSVLGEAVSQHLGIGSLAQVFPGLNNATSSFLGYLS